MKSNTESPYLNINGMYMFLNTLTYRKPHFHTNPELIFVMRGELTANIEYATYTLKEDDMILINSGGSHELISVGNDCLFLCLQFTSDLHWEIGRKGRFDDNIPRKFFSQREYETLKRYIIQSAIKYFNRDEHYELYCTAMTELILYALITKMPYRNVTNKNLTSRGQMTERLLRMVDYVEKNYSNKISLSDFAHSEGVTPTYMSHFVKSTINQSFQNYVNTVRFYSACQLISKGSDDLIDVCYAVGFSDYRYFSKEFKERTGMTPAVYRKNIEKEKYISTEYDFEHIHSVEESKLIMQEYCTRKGFTIETTI